MRGDDPWTTLSKTALGMARVRAEESRRADRLFNDPLAEAFLAAAPDVFAEDEQRAPRDPHLSSLGALFYASAVLRTRFFDDYLLAATATGCRQLVLLAAGLDTRAFRIDWPAGTRLFELDLSEMINVKQTLLGQRSEVPRCTRVVVPADLRADWPAHLIGTGCTPGETTAWLAEGLLIYLSRKDAASLLSTITELSAPDTQLALEHGSSTVDRISSQAQAMPTMRPFTSLWKGGLGNDTPGWLTEHGWLVELHDSATVAAGYGRATPVDLGGGFVTATRQRQPVDEAPDDR